MKNSALILLILLALGCSSSGCRQGNVNSATTTFAPKRVKLVLPPSLQNRAVEFDAKVVKGTEILTRFAKLYGWDHYTEEPFFDSVMIFGNKKTFDITLLTLAGADTAMKLPESFCGALEKRTLTLMTPEYYAKVYPEGAGDLSYERLIAHEMAHRLHVRILEGNEEAMGPVWFYEGFALYAAGQFAGDHKKLTGPEMTGIINDPERGSYRNYAAIFRHVAGFIPLKTLIRNAGDPGFNEMLIRDHAGIFEN